ncbi:hypothetical protein [Pseudomonas monsensis]
MQNYDVKDNSLEDKIREMMIDVTGDGWEKGKDRKMERGISYREFFEVQIKVEANGSQQNISLKNFIADIDDFLDSFPTEPSTWNGQIEETINSKTIFCAVSLEIINF